jgi:hypothetical protein
MLNSVFIGTTGQPPTATARPTHAFHAGGRISPSETSLDAGDDTGATHQTTEAATSPSDSSESVRVSPVASSSAPMAVMKLPVLCRLSPRPSRSLRARRSARRSARPAGRSGRSRGSRYAGPPCRQGRGSSEEKVKGYLASEEKVKGYLVVDAPKLVNTASAGAGRAGCNEGEASLGVLAMVTEVSIASTEAGSRHSPSDSEVLASGELLVACAPSPANGSSHCACSRARSDSLTAGR